MKRIKKILTIGFVLVLVLSLAACGGDKTEPTSGTNASGSSASEAASSANKLDYASEELQEVSADRASKDTIIAAYHDWFNGELDATARAELVYEDFVTQLGCEASWYNAWGNYRVYTWEADGEPFAKVGATFEEAGGVWKCKYFNGNNIGAS